MRRSRKLVSILLTLSLLCTLLLPLAAPAAAAGTYSAVTAPTVGDDGDQSLGRVRVTFDISDIATKDTLFFRLPSDFKVFTDEVDFADVRDAKTTSGKDTLDDGTTTFVELSVKSSSNAITLDDIAIYKVSDREFKVEYDGDATNKATEDEATFYVDFKNVYVPSHDGDIQCEIDAPNNSAFSDGSVVIGKTSSGDVTVSVVDSQTSNDKFKVKVRVEEAVDGSLEDETDSLKLILPDGYEWSGNVDVTSANIIWGDVDFAGKFTADEDEISFDPTAESDEATCFEVELEFEVVDESDVEPGDIEAKVQGDSDVSPSTLVIGKYGEYSANVEAADKDDLPTVYAGQVEQEISNIIVEEDIEGSLVPGRYIRFELPSFAKWTTVPDVTSADHGIKLRFDGCAGSDGNVIKYEVVGGGVDEDEESTDAAELELEDMEVMLDVTAETELTVTVSGNAGVEGEFAVAKIAQPLTAKAESKPEVKIGLGSQKIGDIVLTETEAGAIEEDKDVVLKLPAGVEFAKLPKVEVLSGDLDLDIAGISRTKPSNTDLYQQLVIPVDGDSNEVSSIKVSDIYVNVDRTVAEGDLKVSVKGDAILESNSDEPQDEWFNDSIEADGADIDNDGNGDYDVEDDESVFPNTSSLTSVAAAIVSTPAPGETKANASFVIGSTTYTLNGAEQTMDIAPYIKGDRTYLPVRFVGYALGIAEDNIMWDQATQKVTLINGNTIAQLTVGSNILMVNGMPITMEVAPENVNGRVCLPIRFVAQAFGANVGWDAATQTVTIN